MKEEQHGTTLPSDQLTNVRTTLVACISPGRLKQTRVRQLITDSQDFGRFRRWTEPRSTYQSIQQPGH